MVPEVSFVLVALFGLMVAAAMAGVAIAGVIALRNMRAFERDSQLVAGVASSAPTAWAGSQDLEARLHRRLRDALLALDANQAFDDDGGLLDLRVELQQQAMVLDEQLVATAALPAHLRTDPLEQLTGAVGVIEQAVADLATSSAHDAAARVSAALEDVRSRTGLVAQARAALDSLDNPATETRPEQQPGT